MRDLGFVVGQTDWRRMMDPTQGESALTRTKFIPGRFDGGGGGGGGGGAGATPGTP